MGHRWKQASLQGASGAFGRCSRNGSEIDENHETELRAKFEEMVVALWPWAETAFQKS
jgi:hypothetical protein